MNDGDFVIVSELGLFKLVSPFPPMLDKCML